MLSKLSRSILNLCGWNITGQPPNLKKYVIIVAPHTSNWDFFIFVLLKFYLKIKVNFIGKHTIFVGPFGWALRRLGGIPVKRDKSHKVVDSIIQAFKQQPEMIFALSPEGTRSFKDHWKSGFYHICLNANVPLQLAFLDKTTMTIGFGPLLEMTGNEKQDLLTISNFYADKAGIRPSLFSNICFKQKAE